QAATASAPLVATNTASKYSPSSRNRVAAGRVIITASTAETTAATTDIAEYNALTPTTAVTAIPAATSGPHTRTRAPHLCASTTVKVGVSSAAPYRLTRTGSATAITAVADAAVPAAQHSRLSSTTNPRSADAPRRGPSATGGV